MCPNETTTTSGVSLTWSSTPAGETAVLSCPNTDGNATRRCTDGGVWKEPNVQECTNAVTFSQSNVPEMTMSPSVIVEVTSSLSDVPVMTSSQSVLAGVTSSPSDVPEMTSSQSVLAGVTSSVSEITPASSVTTFRVQTLSISEISQRTSSSLLALLVSFT